MKLVDIFNAIILERLHENAGDLLYRGQQSGRSYTNHRSGAIFFSPNKEYAMDYGDKLLVTRSPSDIFDARKSSDRSTLRRWIQDKLDDIIDTDEYDELSSEVKGYYRDCRRFLTNDDFNSVMRALINLGIAMSDGFGNYVVGYIEKQFMDENNIDAMYCSESGLTNGKPGSELSVAFRAMPTDVKYLT